MGENRQSGERTKLLWSLILLFPALAASSLSSRHCTSGHPICQLSFVLPSRDHALVGAQSVLRHTGGEHRSGLQPRLYTDEVCPRRLVRMRASVANQGDVNVSEEGVEDDDDEEEETEWVLEEYDQLEEPDFYRAEFKVGTLWDDKAKSIEETWVRLLVDDDGNNVAVWGDGAQGRWSLDKPSSEGAAQFFSISKDSWGGWFGKRIWAGLIDDYYFLQGTVRGWSPLRPAAVLGQWQGKRLGVDPEEMGTAPWFEEEEEQVEAVDGEGEENNVEDRS